jgi:hypothetical protein
VSKIALMGNVSARQLVQLLLRRHDDPDAAIAHAVEQGWLLAAGNPVTAFCLCRPSCAAAAAQTFFGQVAISVI